MSWYNNNFNKWINWYVENPFKTWWSVRKYFKRPKFCIRLTTMYSNCPFAYYGNVGRVLEIRFQDVSWKDKYNSPRHERNPYIWICLFHKYVFALNQLPFYYIDESGAKHDITSQYWERILNFLYYRKEIRQTAMWVYWSKYMVDENKKEKVFPIQESGYLTEKGVERLQSEVKLYLEKRDLEKIKETTEV